MSATFHEIPIEGLRVELNRVIIDKRGILMRLAPRGISKVENIIGVLLLKKGVPRGGHYHFKRYDQGWVVLGTAILYFYDFRKDSSSFGKSWAVLVGREGFKLTSALAEIPDLTVKTTQKIAKILIPPGVYHLIIPLKAPVVFLEVASERYSEKDYQRIDLRQIQDPVLEKIKKFYVKS